MNSWCTVSLYSHFFSSMWWMQKIWSVVDVLCQNPHWWSPIISSVLGLNLERKILNNILYEVDNSDITQLLQSLLSPFLWIDTIIGFFHWSGNSSLFQIKLISLWIAVMFRLLLERFRWNLNTTWWFMLFQLYNINVSPKTTGTRYWWFSCMDSYLSDITYTKHIQ
jgi:hypothetical protein